MRVRGTSMCTFAERMDLKYQATIVLIDCDQPVNFVASQTEGQLLPRSVNFPNWLHPTGRDFLPDKLIYLVFSLMNEANDRRTN